MKYNFPVSSALSNRAASEEDVAGVLNGEVVPMVRRIQEAVNRTGGYLRRVDSYVTLYGNEALVEVDATDGAVTVTLADPASTWREVKIVKTDASGNAVTVEGPIGGGTSVTLAAQYDATLLWPGLEKFYE